MISGQTGKLIPAAVAPNTIRTLRVDLFVYRPHPAIPIKST